jgi:hypothetical protein
MTVLDSLTEQDWRDAVVDAAAYPVQTPSPATQTLLEQRDSTAA